MHRFFRAAYFIPLVFICCGHAKNKIAETNTVVVAPIINKQGSTILNRFNTLKGFDRVHASPNSFANFLRNLPLKPNGSKVKYYNGASKSDAAYIAVVKMPISDRDLQQCADAVMRLRGEYFYAQKAYDKISFPQTNDFKADYSEWIKGNRMVVNGNNTGWKKLKPASNTYQDFRNYMELIFTYAGTLSLSKHLHSKNIKDLAIGDVFIHGGSPGHAIIVVDVARNKAGDQIFMIAQSYMPAQETQILKNPSDIFISPWYSADIKYKLRTPEWTFGVDELKTW